MSLYIGPDNSGNKIMHITENNPYIIFNEGIIEYTFYSVPCEWVFDYANEYEVESGINGVTKGYCKIKFTAKETGYIKYGFNSGSSLNGFNIFRNDIQVASGSTYTVGTVSFNIGDTIEYRHIANSGNYTSYAYMGVRNSNDEVMNIEGGEPTVTETQMKDGTIYPETIFHTQGNYLRWEVENVASAVTRVVAGSSNNGYTYIGFTSSQRTKLAQGYMYTLVHTAGSTYRCLSGKGYYSQYAGNNLGDSMIDWNNTDNPTINGEFSPYGGYSVPGFDLDNPNNSMYACIAGYYEVSDLRIIFLGIKYNKSNHSITTTESITNTDDIIINKDNISINGQALLTYKYLHPSMLNLSDYKISTTTSEKIYMINSTSSPSGNFSLETVPNVVVKKGDYKVFDSDVPYTKLFCNNVIHKYLNTSNVTVTNLDGRLARKDLLTTEFDAGDMLLLVSNFDIAGNYVSDSLMKIKEGEVRTLGMNVAFTNQGHFAEIKTTLLFENSNLYLAQYIYSTYTNDTINAGWNNINFYIAKVE